MENWKLLAGVVVGTLVLVFGVAVLFSGESEEKRVDEGLLVGEARHVISGSDLLNSVQASASAEVAATGSAKEETARVTVVEFSDFQCPVCRAAQEPIKKVLKANPETVRLVYRHFPLEQIHNNAMSAAVASEVMADEGLFWEYHDLLYERQEEWEEEAEIEEKLADYAEELGVDRAWFLEELKSDELRKRVRDDLGVASVLGLSGTPSVFVEGKLIEWNRIGAEVEAALAEK